MTYQHGKAINTKVEHTQYLGSGHKPTRSIAVSCSAISMEEAIICFRKLCSIQSRTFQQTQKWDFQALIDYKYWHLDAWINLQSYIFEEDSHQEAFTIGINTIHRWNDKYSKFHFYTPIQFLTQHRGGEQDTTSLGVQTLMNGSVGLTTRYNANMKGLNTLDLSINVLGCFQESGELWPKNKGAAFNIEASANMWKYLYVKGGIFKAPEYYVNLFGSPLFSTYNMKTDKVKYSVVCQHITYALTTQGHTPTNVHWALISTYS